MKPFLIVGYGNPLRGDDGVGWRVATQLFEQLGAEQCDVFTMHQLVPEVADELAKHEIAVLIDASADQEPGSVRIRELKAEGENAGEGRPLSHHVGPGELLALAASLYGHAPRTFLVTIGAASFGYTETLSPAAEAGAHHALKLIAALLRLVRPLSD